MLWFQCIWRLIYLSIQITTGSSLVLGAVSAASPHQQQSAPFGIAWRVNGSWKEDGLDHEISNGDVVFPRSLLHPEGSTGQHSILILLPDGQRILYECYLRDDCAHSFRVPMLYRNPTPSAVDLLARVHEVLIEDKRNGEASVHQNYLLPRDEAITLLGSENQIQIGGLAAALANGHYTYDLQPLDHQGSRQTRVPLEKTTSSITLTVPSVGLYELTIFDNLNTPRINLFVGAVRPGQKAEFLEPFTEARALIEGWNGDYQGWPIHDLERAYLRSLFLDIKPQRAMAKSGTVAVADSSDQTAEPRFTPIPGLFKEDTEVTLRCDTPGAVIHYTVDGSQPLNNSSVYAAPIMVKGTALTIKAFAAAPGKKDSPVVTGSFRIGD
jgi:Fn3 associated